MAVASPDLISNIVNIIWVVFIVVSVLFSQRIMMMQILVKSEQFANQLDEMTEKSKKHLIRKITKKPTRELREKLNNFLEFFVIEPVNLDPYGIIKKLDHLVNLEEKKFKYFVDQLAPDLGVEEKASMMGGLSGSMSLNQLSKIVRHYIELTKKTKSLQYALLLQMQIPLIEKIAKALLSATEALANSWPIGDCAGCMVAAKMIGDSRFREIEEDTVVARKKIKGKIVYVVKAKGPGGRLGKLGRSVEKIISRNKVSKIITIDAAAKLEGEKTGVVAEGIGVAIGGIGVDRYYIENVAVQKNIPLDSVIIKMGQEEALEPIRREILVAVPKAIDLVEKDIEQTKEKGAIIVVGVGNTSGVGNDKKAAEEADKQAVKIMNIVKNRKEEKKRNWLGWLSG